MSETTTSALTGIKDQATKLAADNAKLKTDVATILTNMSNAGPLNAEQTAMVGDIKALLSQADADATEADATVTQPATPPTP